MQLQVVWVNTLPMGKSTRATTIGTVSTAEKAEVAKAAGCHFPVVRSENFVDVVWEVTSDEGAQ